METGNVDVKKFRKLESLKIGGFESLRLTLENTFQNINREQNETPKKITDVNII